MTFSHSIVRHFNFNHQRQGFSAIDSMQKKKLERIIRLSNCDRNTVFVLEGRGTGPNFIK